MTASDIAVILNRLDQLEDTLRQIHGEVKRTNGRVTELEMTEARYEGEEKAKEMQQVIITSVLSGAALAGLIWVVAYLAR